MPQPRRPFSSSRRGAGPGYPRSGCLLRSACRALLWHMLSGAVTLERGLRRAWEGCRPVGGLPPGREWSNGRFRSPCVVVAADRDAGAARLAWGRSVPWSRVALTALALLAFLGGALVGTVHGGKGRAWLGQAAIA